MKLDILGCQSPNRLGKRTRVNQGFLVSLVIELATGSEPTSLWQPLVGKAKAEAVKVNAIWRPAAAGAM